ncbi:MAG TPA: riboflavin synthase [Kiritimatiellia bacterium]|nr:riboflavin synthase [Kiritimatiellia bacterium]HPS07152.1 riboflavin synthase [Kiritimatiellia bacterium]
MFTGLVQKVGVLQRLARQGDGWSLTLLHPPWPDALVPGESVAVQGACLTVTAVGNGFFTADVLDETLRRTALQARGEGARVNLERALAVGDRLGGHIVSGHVDECGTLSGIEDRGRDVAWRVRCSPELARQTVMKGSVAIDGVSLTVTGLGDDWLEVNLIPTTLRETSLCDRRGGDAVNLEGDILGKYVARLLGHGPRCGITEQMLAENGFL